MISWPVKLFKISNNDLDNINSNLDKIGNCQESFPTSTNFVANSYVDICTLSLNKGIYLLIGSLGTLDPKDMMGISILLDTGEKINGYCNSIACYYKSTTDNNIVKLRAGLTFNYTMMDWNSSKDYLQSIRII